MYAIALSILAEYRKTPNNYSNGTKVLEAAQKFFSEVDLVGVSRSTLEALLGPPDIDRFPIPNSAGYNYGNGEEFVIRRFRFDSAGRVESIEIFLSQ